MEYHGEHHIISAFDSGNETKMVEKWMNQLYLDPLRDGFEDELLSLSEKVVELNQRKAFLEGVASYLGGYNASDTEAMLKVVKKRYVDRGVKLSKTIKFWFQIPDRAPSIDPQHRRNLYDFCYAMGMDYKETAEFFLKSFLTIPYNYKDRVDAVYFYCLKMRKDYDTISRMLAEVKEFEATNPNVDFTEEIGENIFSITDDDEFVYYLRKHCYDTKHQNRTARAKLAHYIKANKSLVPTVDFAEFNDKTLGTESTNMLLNTILGFDYSKYTPEQRKKYNEDQLPAFPREAELHRVVAEKDISKSEISFDVLRKSLILMVFYNFYRHWQKDKKRFYMDGDEINENLYDFLDEVNKELAECGFIQLYPQNPYDGIILFCANSPNPLEFLKKYVKKWYLKDDNLEDIGE